LEGVLVSLIAQSSLNFKKIDLELAREVVQSFVNQINNEVTIDSVIQLVAEQYKIPAEKMKGTARHRQIVMARQLAMFFAKKYTDKSLKHIGEYFGGKDHTTVLYSCNTAKDLMDTDLVFRQIAESVEKKLTKHPRYK
jgi:chromosomal replication initiator protein